jgi:hypothetical protein
MQTFVPLESFTESARVLDLKRLGKQVIEAGQIARALADPEYGWQSHPATRMWRGHMIALLDYTVAVGDEWERRRGKPHGALANLWTWIGDRAIQLDELDSDLPAWWGDAAVHSSHRANLLRKDPEHYGVFGWTEDPEEGYVWPAP